jgi:hypothetical protein
MTHVVLPRWKKDATTGILEIPTSWWNTTRSFCLRLLEEKTSEMQISNQRACIIHISNAHRNWQCFGHNRSAIGGGSAYTSQQQIELMWNKTVLEGASIPQFSHTPTDTGPNCHWESVLFIGTQFSILYTSMYLPAEAGVETEKEKFLCLQVRDENTQERICDHVPVICSSFAKLVILNLWYCRKMTVEARVSSNLALSIWLEV